jgi:glycyl-tRNA synthetase
MLKSLIKSHQRDRKARARFDAFNEQNLLRQMRVMEYKAKERNSGRMARSLGNEDLEDVKALIEELEIACPESGSRIGPKCVNLT